MENLLGIGIAVCVILCVVIFKVVRKMPKRSPLKEQKRLGSVNVKDQLLENIRNGIIGSKTFFKSPYGVRKLTYADYIASGKHLEFIEKYIQDEVNPRYANVHTKNSITGLQTTLFRDEARQIIFDACKCAKGDELIFVGQGATTCSNLLVNLVYGKEEYKGKKIIVFNSVYEHHSNILPYRERNAKVIVIPENEKGVLDMVFLKKQLIEYSKDKNNVLIGSFSAGSNISGILLDTVKITQMLHEFGALAFFDYAAAAPYIKIEMNSMVDGREWVNKDAIFFSCHKFIGGPGGPGILLIKKKLFKKVTPFISGGGTVSWVSEKTHTYFDQVAERFEGGTPFVVGCIKAGLVFQLKAAVGDELIEKRERIFISKALERLKKKENFVLLGNPDVPRLAVLSFLIKHGALFLHCNFVTRLLNDLFGIQTRSGCMCAGIYAQSLLGMNEKMVSEYGNLLKKSKDNKHEILRPGFTRLNFNYFISDEEFDFIVTALEFVADHGWKFLVEYTFVPKTSEWLHRLDLKFKYRRWIHHVDYRSGKFVNNSPKEFSKDEEQTSLSLSHKNLFKSYLEKAKKHLKEDVLRKSFSKLHGLEKNLFDNEINVFRWFLYPGEASIIMKDRKYQLKQKSILIPKVYGKEATKIVKLVVEEESDDEEFPFGNITVYGDSGSGYVENLWKEVPFQMLKRVYEAVERFEMIKPGDKILLGISGGKDSLTMLHVLKALRDKSRIKFDFGAVTIDPQANSYDPSPLKEYLKKLKVPYFYESHNIIELAKKHCTASICSWCSRMKRGILYKTCRENKYNVLILAQHLDDLAESFLMSVFHNGFLRTMKASYQNDDGDIRIIRPLVFCREKELKLFARKNKLPIIYENCPACFAKVPTERLRVKKLLKEQEQLFPNLFSSLAKALTPLMEKSIDGVILKGKFKTKKEKDSEEKEGKSALTGVSRKMRKIQRILKVVHFDYLKEAYERRNQQRKNRGKEVDNKKTKQ